MAIARSESFAIRVEADILLVRSIVRRWSVEIGFRLVDQTRLTTAASELARNTLVHGRGGMATVDELRENARVGLRMIFEDRGPGIADIGKAMTDGFTTARGLGLGLGGSKRLVHEFSIASTPGQGTRVVIAHFTRA